MLGFDDILRVLVEAGADVGVCVCEQCLFFVWLLFLLPSHEFCAVLATGTSSAARFMTTPLHMAALYDHAPCIDILFAAEADINARDAKQCTPLHYAALSDSASAARHLIDKVLVFEFLVAWHTE